MADANRARPLSPHLTIYRPQLNSAMSIFHRLTGIGMAVGAVLIVWWLMGGAMGEEYFQTIDDVLTSTFGIIVLIGVTWALSYHMLNGIRHLFWDMGRGFDLKTVDMSGYAVLAGSVVLTLVVWLAL